MHPGGVIVAPGLLTDLVPVMNSGGKGVVITQLDLDSVEALGLVKIDLLGIRGLTIVGGFMFLGSQAWEWFHFIEGSEKGAYVLADGRFARTDDAEPGVLKFHDGTMVEGSEAEALIASSTKNIHGANLTENEYGNTPLFGNFFFFITGFHGFHVFSGVLINVIVFILVYQGALDRKKDYELVEKVGLYWHFVNKCFIVILQN